MKPLLPAKKNAYWPFKGIEKLYLDLTRMCPRKCIHCYNNSGPNGLQSSITFGKWLSIITQGKDLNCNRLQLTGGEATLYPYYKDLIDFASAIGFKSIELFSGCSIPFSQKEMDFFRLNHIIITTSFYSTKPEIHNKIVRRNDYDTLKNNLVNLINRGIKLKVGIVLMNENSSEYWSSANFLKSIGVNQIYPDFVRSYGRASKMKGIPNIENICGGAHRHLTILPNGNAISCPFWPKKIGNINHHTLEEIINSEKLRTVRIKILKDWRKSILSKSN